jgi:hypothetical protein
VACRSYIFDLLRDRRFATGLLTAFLLTFANISFHLLITLCRQRQLAITQLQSGAAVIPLAVVFALASRASGPRAQRLGALALIQGCTVAIAGLVVLIAVVGWVAAPLMPALASVLSTVQQIGRSCGDRRHLFQACRIT